MGLLGLGLDTVARNEAEAKGRDDMAVIVFSATPTSFVSLDGSGFPVLVSTITAMTTKGPVTITQTIDSF